MTNMWRTVTIGTFSIAYECQQCGVLCWGSGKSIHEKWHDRLDRTERSADRADSMTKPIAGPREAGRNEG